MPGNRLAHPSPVPADREPVDGHGLEAVYAIPGSWADHERAGRLKAPSLPPLYRGGGRGGGGGVFGLGWVGGEAGVGEAVANLAGIIIF
jgi:hypothetical protein